MYFLRIFTIGAKSLLKNSSWWLLPPVIQPEMLWIFSWNYDVITSRKRLCLLRNEFSMKCRWFIWNMISSKSAVRLYIFDWAPSLLGLRSIKNYNFGDIGNIFTNSKWIHLQICNSAPSIFLKYLHDQVPSVQVSRM